MQTAVVVADVLAGVALTVSAVTVFYVRAQAVVARAQAGAAVAAVALATEQDRARRTPTFTAVLKAEGMFGGYERLSLRLCLTSTETLVHVQMRTPRGLGLSGPAVALQMHPAAVAAWRVGLSGPVPTPLLVHVTCTAADGIGWTVPVAVEAPPAEQLDNLW